MAKDKIIVDSLYPTVKANLAKKENQVALKKAVGEYLDRNMVYLTKIGPMDQIVITETDRKAIYDATGLTPEKVLDVLKQSPEIKQSGENMKEPFNTVCTLAIKYFYEVGNKEMTSISLVYLTMSMYPSLFSKYYKFKPNEQVMNYTINNLSQKFKIKQLGTLYAALIETSTGTFKLHKDRLKEGTDKNIIRFVLDIKTRQNSLMKKIKNEYEMNKSNKLYINLDSDSYEEDNYHEADNNTFAIERIANSVLMKLTVNGPDMRNVNMSAKICKVSVSELRNYVNTMVTNENREDIKTVLESILFLFLFNDKNSVDEINSSKFLLYCLDIYKKSNTTDENIIRIKKVLDKWLEDMGTYKKTQRAATINNFRRALFLFFVITIQVQRH